jgi:hypothetical protein
MRTWVLLLFTAFTWIVAGAQTCTVAEHRLWLGKAFTEIQTIQPGMSRQDLLKVFTRPGGVYALTRLTATYAYKNSQHIRVDVEFTPASGTEESSAENPKDVIKTISKPYLAEPAYD